MATVSYIEPIGCETSRNSSIDSILSSGSGLPGLRITNHLTCDLIDTEGVRTISHSRRSISSSRHHQHTGMDEVNRSQREHIWNLESDEMKNIQKMSTSKESGGRRILSFLQRGFNTKRPKSIGKTERKNTSHHYSEVDASLSDPFDGQEVITNTTEGLRILNQQIYLPDELLSTYLLEHEANFKRHPAQLRTSERTSKIYPIDSSLFDTGYRHCFQVISSTQNNATLLKNNAYISLPTTSYELCRSREYGRYGRVSLEETQRTKVHTYTCPTALERSRWILFLKRLVCPTRDIERRRENCLHIWIQEAKGLAGCHSYHCEILLDGIVYAKTTSKRLTDMLFWGEEFDLSGLSDFQTLTVELWIDSDGVVNSKHRIPSAHGMRERTYTHLSEQRVCSTGSLAFTKTMMSCAKGSGMAVTDDCHEGALDDKQQTHTGEGISSTKLGTKRGKMRRRSKRTRQPSLIASVHIPATKLGLASELECWYPASVREFNGRITRSDLIESSMGKGRSGKRHHLQASGIQLRIKTRYQTICVLPLAAYSRLQHYLSCFRASQALHPKSNSHAEVTKPDSAVLLSDLDPWLGVKMKAELAGSVVALHQALGQASEFLSVLILHEVYKQSDPNMVLRGNSIATKATEIYLRLVGETYLFSVLEEFVRTVLTGNQPRISPAVHHPMKTAKQSRHLTPTTMDGATTNDRNLLDCEVDTNKLENTAQLAQNQANLLGLVHMVWDRIVASEAYFPSQLRLVFATVRQHLDCAFPTSNPGGASLSEHVISACLFLRYLCPAILSPSLFGLTAEFPSNPRVLRTFTLVAKTIQSLANFSLFSGSKEVYMTFMNQFVSDQLPAMHRFLHAISSPVLHITHEPPGVSAPTFSDGSRVLSSQSHHGGFNATGVSTSWMESQCATNISSFMTRSSSGLPTTTTPRGSPTRTVERLKMPEGSMASSMQDLPYNPVELPHRVREPIPLPELRKPCTGDYVDLALCLALCHLQLTEAFSSIPSEKLVPYATGLIAILGEIDFFLASGVDPQPNWWCPSSKKQFMEDSYSVSAKQNSCDQSQPSGQISVTSVQVDSSPNSVKLDQAGSLRTIVVADTQSIPIQDANERRTDDRDARITAYPVGTIERHDRLPDSLIFGTAENSKNTKDPSNYSIQSQFVVDNPENIDPTDSVSESLTQPVSISPGQSRVVVKTVANPVERNIQIINLNDHRAPNSEGTFSSVVHCSVTSTPWEILTEDPMLSSKKYQNLYSQKRNKLPEYEYVAHCNSSGYHSLGSHDHGEDGLQKQQAHTKPVNATFSSTVPPPGLAMNNPLYIVHGAFNTNSAACSRSGSIQSSPSKDSKIMAAEVTPVRSRSFSSHEYRRRHTYVNLMDDENTEAVLMAVHVKTTSEDSSATSLSSDSSVTSDDAVTGKGSTLVSSQTESVCSKLTIPNTKEETGSNAATVTTINPPPIGRSEGLTHHVTTLNAVLEGYDIRPSITSTESIRSVGYPIASRTDLVVTDSQATIPANIRDELDASQARLAEAQARLLANEAERIQLLRAWHNELMKQSQLVNRGGLTGSNDLREVDKLVLRMKNDWTPQTTAQAHSSVPLSGTWISAATGDSISTISRSHRIAHATQPRMGTTVVTTADPNQTTLPRSHPARREQSLHWFNKGAITPESATISRSPSLPGLFNRPSRPPGMVHPNVFAPTRVTNTTSSSHSSASAVVQ